MAADDRAEHHLALGSFAFVVFVLHGVSISLQDSAISWRQPPVTYPDDLHEPERPDRSEPRESVAAWYARTGQDQRLALACGAADTIEHAADRDAYIASVTADAPAWRRDRVRPNADPRHPITMILT